MPATSASSASEANGATSFQRSPSFLSDVVSPALAFTVTSAILPASSDAKTFAFLLAVLRGGLALRLVEVDVGAEADENGQQHQRRSQSPHGYRLRHHVTRPATNARHGMTSTER